MKRIAHIAVIALTICVLQSLGGVAQAATPTCSDTLGIAVHGQHIVADYVTGIGHGVSGWPMAGDVGKTIAGKGAVTPGGPGPGFHFGAGFAPGASFCTGSNSPGIHL